MARIYKRKKIWYIDYAISGRRRRKAIGHLKEIAQLALKDIEVRIAKERAGFPLDGKLADWRKDFDRYIGAHLRPRSAERYREAIEHFFVFLSKTYDILPNRLSQVKSEMIEDFKLWRLERVKKNTVNTDLNILRRFFNLAIKRSYLSQNPVKNVEFLKTYSKRPRFLTREEIIKLIPELPKTVKPIVSVLLNTGMRLGELQNLEWSDIDFEKEEIHITFKNDWIPKGGKERNIPLNKKAKEVLLAHPHDQELIFHTKENNKIHRNRILQGFKRTCRRVGIKDANIHTLRHTFASHLVMTGVDLVTVSKLLGHKDISTTMIYSHLSSNHLQQAVEKLDL